MAEQHIFEPIDSFDTKHFSKSERVKVITDTEAVLRDLGVDLQLAKDVADTTQYLEPLLSLIYRRQPPEEEGIKAEGRGVYHDKIPVEGRQTTVYVKGIGNRGLIESVATERPFPGFPSSSDQLMFDHLLSLSEHPRILGTETLPWGFLEYINSCVVFSQIAASRGWKNMRQAVDAGVTVPVGMTYFRELSAYLVDLLKKRIQETPYEIESQQLKWEGNFLGLGSLGQIVPYDKRLPRLPNEDYEKPDQLTQDYKAFLDTDQWKTSGRTLRILLEMGIAYSEESSHGQNMYGRGLLAQGDNSDLVFLGDYVDIEKEDLFEGNVRLTGKEQRRAVIFRMLNRHDGLTPLAYPVPEFDIRWETVVQGQQKFWKEFLGGIAHPRALEQIHKLAPVLREQLNLAASIISQEKLDNPKWDRLAAQRKRVLAKYDSYGAGQELEKKIENNLKSYSTLSYRREADPAKDVLGFQAVLKFLQTGDLRFVREDVRTGPYLQLAEAIYAIKDTKLRDRLLNKIGKFQLERDLSLIAEGRVNIDVIDIFNAQHIERLNDLLSKHEYENAEKIIESLNIIDHWHLADSHPKSKAEYMLHYYGLKLLRPDSDVNEIYEQIKFFEALFHFRSNTDPGLMAAVFMSETFKNFDIYKYANDNHMTNPRFILSEILGAQVNNRPERRRLYQFFESYENMIKELVTTGDEKQRESIIQRLRGLSDSMGRDYPEIPFAYNCNMATYYRARNPALAEKYYREAMRYYDRDYERRKKETGIVHDLYHTDKDRALREQRAASINLKSKYMSLGFDKIASEYGKY